MGWKWEDDDDVASSNWISSENHNPRNLSEDRCSTRKIVKSSCRTEEVEPGRFVRKCDKTEQIFRDCVGRPTEIVESKNEHTEDDVTDEVISGKRPFELSQGLEPFSFPGLRSDIESIEQSLYGGLGHFLEAAEQMAEGMTKGFFHSFNIPSHRSKESSSFGSWLPPDRKNETNGSKQMDESSAYNGLPGEITDV